MCRRFGTLCLFHLPRQVRLTYLPRKMEQTECSETSHIKFRRRGITQKKTYNILNTAKVWNQEPYICIQDLHCERAKSSQHVPWRKSLNVKCQAQRYSCPYALYQGTWGIRPPLFHSYIGSRCRCMVSFTLRQILFLVSIEQEDRGAWSRTVRFEEEWNLLSNSQKTTRCRKHTLSG
jgi:hypothetical protein